MPDSTAFSPNQTQTPGQNQSHWRVPERMMMIGDGGHLNSSMIHAPPWSNIYDDPTAGVSYTLPVSGVASGAGVGGGDLSPYLLGEALQRYLPCNEPYLSEDLDESDMPDSPVDAYSCDEFRMYEFKVRRCARGRSHDWTECPYAHPGEKARRRDPRKFHYSGTACPDFRKGSCKRGDACEFAHGVFECWLHPARYRTQPCKDGVNCRRRVCFFAHTPEQLRVLPQSQQSPRTPVGSSDSYDGSPLRHHALEAYFPKSLMASSPTSTLISPPVSPPSESPPLSPSGQTVRRAILPSGSSVNEVLVSLRQLQLNKASSAPCSWGMQVGVGIRSPRGISLRPGISSLPSTPTRTAMINGSGSGLLDTWEEPTERVESGRDLRAKIFEKLNKETLLEKPEKEEGGAVAAPDVGWVSDLVK